MMTELSRLSVDYRRIRQTSAAICAPLARDDYQIQSIVETSPPKWHLGHVTWFFETFLLQAFVKDYQPYHPDYHYLFNSYYQTVGSMQPRAERGLLSRPTVEEIYAYRAAIDERMMALLLDTDASQQREIAARVTLGLHHEQQHQELLYMDIKHNFWRNPLRPIYLPKALPTQEASALTWEHRDAGLIEIGCDANSFAYDNERPRHKVWLEPHRLANRLTTNAEYLAFIEDGGYQRAELWLADGWFHRKQHDWQAPLYWEQREGVWHEFTLHGFEPLNPHAPVAHTS